MDKEQEERRKETEAALKAGKERLDEIEAQGAKIRESGKTSDETLEKFLANTQAVLDSTRAPPIRSVP
jgi:hypothetical protein